MQVTNTILDYIINNYSRLDKSRLSYLLNQCSGVNCREGYKIPLGLVEKMPECFSIPIMLKSPLYSDEVFELVGIGLNSGIDFSFLFDIVKKNKNISKEVKDKISTMNELMI